jgi:serine/threonine protein kinase
MSPEQLARVSAVYRDALRVPPPEREAFLDSYCEDIEVRAEVESLLVDSEEGTDVSDPSATAIPATGSGEASATSDRSPLLPGVVLKGRYRLKQQLGKGSMSRVFLAADEQLHSRLVVVKALLDENINPWFERRFSDEIRALSNIDHPGVVSVLDSGKTDDGTLYLVMQFAEGAMLRSHIHAGGMPYERVVRLVKQIAQALGAAHEKGIVHHDLKPENIMVQPLPDREERVRLIDFGIARLKPENPHIVTEVTVVAGSPAYMAPEQLTGHGSAAADIYSLGVIAFELLTGARPFKEKNPILLHQLQSDGAFTRPRELRPELPAQAEKVLLKALAFDPQERPSSAHEFSEALTEALDPKLSRLAEPAGRMEAGSPGEVERDVRYDVFLSHASADRSLAVRMVEELERRGIRCFMTPRDVPAGALFPAAVSRRFRHPGPSW